MIAPRKPQRHDRTRQRLLEVAGEVFARTGYRQATIREICRRAKANVAAVNYHFGGKPRLYTAVLEHELAVALDRYPVTLGVEPGDPVEKQLHAFIHSFLLRLLGQGPSATLPRLMAREMVDPSPALDTIVRNVARPMSQRLRQMVREILGPRATDRQVHMCAVSIVGQIFFLRLGQPMILRLFPKFAHTPDHLEALARHITRFSLAAMRHYRETPP